MTGSGGDMCGSGRMPGPYLSHADVSTRLEPALT